jgi:predicted site-specific integrase-resolvase
METLKVDVTKLMTIRRYAQMLDVSVQAVYNWAKDGKINIREIDGVKFVQL